MIDPLIKCLPDGPYLVTGLEKLRKSDGTGLPAKPVMALCRCGGSASKPFCDGTHAKIGFSGARLGGGPRDKRRDYAGARVTIHDNRALCAHAGYCTDELSSVFKSEKSPWIDADGADVASIVALVDRCPSGALSYSMDSADTPHTEHHPSITVMKDGPYAVTGGVELEGERMGEGASRDRYTLCRCGASKNKPFCDGSHWDLPFRDD